ncbi:MAG: alpha/beta hydrolase [Spongiibacteraceae bacterium]
MRFKQLLFTALLLLSACTAKVDLDDSQSHFALPDAHKQHAKLAAIAADNLSQQQLYNRTLSLWGTPYRELSFPTSLGTAHIIVSGPSDGEVLVLLHGMNASSTMWYPNAAALAEHYRIYAIDHILGTGKSEPSKPIESIDQVINWYSEVFNQLQLKNINLVGASQGGWIAVNLALTDSTRVKSLALLSPAQTFTWMEPSSGIVANIWLAINPNRENLSHALDSMSSHVTDINPLYIDQFLNAMTTADLPKFLIDTQPFDDTQLQQLQMPTLVLIGDKDIINSNKSLDRANALLPKVKTKIINDAGHFLNVDQAAATNAALQEFIDNL